MKASSKRILKGVLITGREPICPELKRHEETQKWDPELSELYEKGRNKGHTQGYEIGKSEGYRKGFEEGHKRSFQELSSLIILLKQMIQELEQEQRDVYLRSQPEMITLCLCICEKLLYRSLREETTFLHLIEALLKEGEEQFKQYPTKIYVSPDNLKMLKNTLSNGPDNERTRLNIDLMESDSKLPLGHFRIETKEGLIHFDPKRLLVNLREHLLSLPGASLGAK